MYERILIPLDGSPLAEAVLTQAPELLRRPLAEILLLRAVGFPVGARRDPAVLTEAEDYLRAVATRLAAENVRVRTLVEPGAPADAILDTAAREKASLIAMSTHGRTGLSRWVFGSVAEKTLRASPVPLLLIRSFPQETGSRRFKTILVPLDGSPLSLETIPHAIELALLFGSRIVLLHVFEHERPALALKQPELPLAKGLESVKRSDVRVDQEFRTGDPAHEIVAFSEELPAGLIAMMTHGRSGLSRWMLGSVAEKVLRAAKVPMFVVRATTS